MHHHSVSKSHKKADNERQNV